jgi:ankyrin repeat protein
VSKSKSKPDSTPEGVPDRDTKKKSKPSKGSNESKSHPQAVIDALIEGDLKAIEQYVTKDNINLVDKYGYTLLSKAAVAGDLNLKMVRLLLKHGADVNVRIAEGWSLLHSACHLLQKDLALVLLRAGCDPNAVAAAGHTPLTKVLMALNRKKDLIKTLLEHGADPEAKHGGGESAIDIATRTGQIDLFAGREKIRRVKKSSKPGPAKESSVSKPHPKAVIDALYDGDLKPIEQYITKENINWADKDGHTLLSRAATGGEVQMKVVRLLVRNGADVNVRYREEWTLLHSAADSLNKDLVFVLLNAGCDPNAVDDAGHTPLVKVLSAFNPKKDIIEALLEHGADPDAKYEGGESAREIAAETGQMNLFPARKVSNRAPAGRSRRSGIPQLGGQGLQAKKVRRKGATKGVPMTQPVMEHPGEEDYFGPVEAMADWIVRLRALPQWDRWITFQASGMGHRIDSYHLARIRMRGDEIEIDEPVVLDVAEVTRKAGVPATLLRPAGENKYMLVEGTPEQVAQVLHAIFVLHLGIRGHPDDEDDTEVEEDDYGVAADWE